VFYFPVLVITLITATNTNFLILLNNGTVSHGFFMKTACLYIKRSKVSVTYVHP